VPDAERQQHHQDDLRDVPPVFTEKTRQKNRCGNDENDHPKNAPGKNPEVTDLGIQQFEFGIWGGVDFRQI